MSFSTQALHPGMITGLIKLLQMCTLKLLVSNLISIIILFAYNTLCPVAVLSFLLLLYCHCLQWHLGTFNVLFNAFLFLLLLR